MKKIFSIIAVVIVVITLSSCKKIIEPVGQWSDNIKLSTRTANFNASGDSVIFKTGGSWWWVSDVSVDTTWYYGFAEVNVTANFYSVKRACFVVEHRDNNTLFVKVDANPFNKNRIITVGLEAGDYFDRVTITQKSK